MSASKKLNRRSIYQNEFLYSSFDATGYHFNNKIKSDPTCSLRNLDWESCSGNQVRQLHRIQAINYSSSTNLIDINQYGSAAHIGSLSSDTPDVTLDFEYILSEGYNEQVVGFVTDGKDSAFKNFIVPDGRVGQNFFIITVPQGHDVINYNFNGNGEDIRVVGIGNAFLTQYAMTAEVGSIPRARLSFEGFNMRGYTGFCNLPIPSINPIENNLCKDDIRFSIPDTYESFIYGNITGMEDIEFRQSVVGVSPNNISLSLKNAANITILPSGFNDSSIGPAHIQGFTINVPFGRTKINRMGSQYSFSRVGNFPMNIEVAIRAIVTDLKASNLFETIYSCKKSFFDLEIKLDDCFSVGACDDNSIKQSDSSMYFNIKNAHLSSESFSLDIPDHKIVDIKFTASVFGPEDFNEGLYISGRSFMPKKPKIVSWGNPI